jgi:DNA polymerase-3 subunit epsilon
VKEEAIWYYKKFGFNITRISTKRNMFNLGRNLYKHPNHLWEHLEFSSQSIEFFIEGDWEDVTGIGTVLGFKKLRALDIDYCDDIVFVHELLRVLKLPPNYEWVVKSGSHNGFHILFYSEEKRIDEYKSLKIAYGSNYKYKSVFKKIEFRWKKHLVLPPSLHESNNRYEFLFSKPENKPSIVEIENLLDVIFRFCKHKTNNFLVSKFSFENISSSEQEDFSSSEVDYISSSEQEDFSPSEVDYILLSEQEDFSSSEVDYISSSEQEDFSSSEVDYISSSEQEDFSSSEVDYISSSEQEDFSSSEVDYTSSSEQEDFSPSEVDYILLSEQEDFSSSEVDYISSSEQEDFSPSEVDFISSSEQEDFSSSEVDFISSSEQEDFSPSEVDYILLSEQEDFSSSEVDYISSSEQEDFSSSEVDYISSSEQEDFSSRMTDLYKEYYLFFDTETVGLPRIWKAPVTDLDNWPRMVQIAWVLCDDKGNYIESDDYIISPENFKIPLEVSRVHGISTERAIKEGEDLTRVLNLFNRLIERSNFIVAHNISFDEKIVGAEFLRKSIRSNLNQKRKLCTMELSTDYCKIPSIYGYKWPKLSELHLKLFGKGFEEAHDASIDIEATVKCFWEMRKRGLI